MKGSDLCGARYDALDRRTPIIIPIARFVGRGEGIPLGLEHELLGHVLGQLTGSAVGLPVLPFAGAPESSGVPGSISIPIGLSQLTVQSLLTNLARDRFERVIVLTASPVVGDWLRPAILEFRSGHANVAVALVSLVELARSDDSESTLVRLGAHCGLVKPATRVPSLTHRASGDMPDFLVTLNSELAPDGFLANPSADSAQDDGQEMSTVSRNLEQFVENFARPIVFAEN